MHLQGKISLHFETQSKELSGPILTSGNDHLKLIGHHSNIFRVPQNLCYFYNSYTYVYLQWKCGGHWSSSFWDIWWDMPIFAVSSKMVQLLPTLSWGLLNWPWSNLHRMQLQYCHWIRTVIFLSVLVHQLAEWRSLCKFRPKLVAMATSL